MSRGAALVGDRIQVADARIEVASRFLRPPEGVTLSGVLGGRSALSSTVAVSTRALLVSHLQ